MSSKTKQDVLRFPIRKTRSCKSKQENCDTVLKSEETVVQKRSGLRKKKLDRNTAFDVLASPTKKKCTNNLNSDENEENSAKISLQPVVLVKRTPFKNVDNLLTESPTKFNTQVSATPEKVFRCLNFESPSRSLRRSQSENVSPKKDDIITESPSKCRKITPCKSVGSFSPLKLVKPFNLDSPVRRSPRKLQFENSPSTLLSKLNFASPKTPKTTIGLHTAEFKGYQSLKTSLARNFNNCIVGRETEIKFLEEFLDKCLKGSLPGSLYVSGAPGTGKTASVTKIVDALHSLNFKKVFLNCMSKTTSKEIFTSIAESLKLSVNFTEREIIQRIEKAITTSKVPILLLLDEVDQLESRDQKTLYTIFEWPSLAKSKLVLIGIANMLDLTDRILPRLQASESCRPQLLHFPPYSKTEIVHIINERIKEADNGDVQVIKPSAVHFLAGKVSAVAGDVRKALDVCRRAVELCEIEARRQMRLVNTRSPSKSPRKCLNSVPKQVDIPQIMNIFNQIYGCKVAEEITENPNTFPLQQKVLICSLLLILKHSKAKTASLGKFHEVYSRVCQRQKLPSVEQSEFFSLCTLLESRGMLHVSKSKELRNSKISLRLNTDDAEKALGDTDLLATILEDKSSLTSQRRH